MNWPLLFGDIDDFIKIILIVLFVVFPLIGQIIKGAQGKKAGEKQRPNPRQRPAPRKPAGPQANVQGGARDAVRGEIDTFLQRAAQRRGAGPVQEVEIIEPEVIAEIAEIAPRRLVQASQRQPSSLGSTAKTAGPPIQNETLGQHAEQLGTQVGLADEKAEDHLHHVFDHKLGTLTDTSQDSPQHSEQIAEGTDSQVWESTTLRRQRQSESSEERAQEIAFMLRDPSSLKEAIILSEIIRRPVDHY